jgi:hypothetical protein
VIKHENKSKENVIRPLDSVVTTANGEELQILGVQNCLVEFGTTACYTDLLVAPKLAQECLLGMDILSTCPLTSEAIDTLKNSLNVSHSNNSKKSLQQSDEMCLTISTHEKIQTLSSIREEGDELGSN